MTDKLALFRQLTDAGMPSVQAEIVVTEFASMQTASRLMQLGEKTPIGFSERPCWNWYVSSLSRHPFMNGLVTGLVLAVLEAIVLSPLADGLIKHLCGR